MAKLPVSILRPIVLAISNERNMKMDRDSHSV
jgi:hypothetical protein